MFKQRSAALFLGCSHPNVHFHTLPANAASSKLHSCNKTITKIKIIYDNPSYIFAHPIHCLVPSELAPSSLTHLPSTALLAHCQTQTHKLYIHHWLTCVQNSLILVSEPLGKYRHGNQVLRTSHFVIPFQTLKASALEHQERLKPTTASLFCGKAIMLLVSLLPWLSTCDSK
jgi:hypothetical protein